MCGVWCAVDVRVWHVARGFNSGVHMVCGVRPGPHREESVEGGSAQSVMALLVKKNIKFANQETMMTLHLVRSHLRILRRASMAVSDTSNPTYEYSALYYLDRNEEVFGRRVQEVAFQESVKYLDGFIAAIPDAGDLRNTMETVHYLLLRGVQLKLTGRSTAETAIMK
jgi:hypothetical protein